PGEAEGGVVVVEAVQGDDDGPRRLTFRTPAQIGQPRAVLHDEGAAAQGSRLDARPVELVGRRQRRLNVRRGAGGEGERKKGDPSALSSFSPRGRRWAPEALG